MRRNDSDARYDNWPVEGKQDEDVEWIGFMAKGKAPAGLFEPHSKTFYEGDVDEENEQFVPDPDSERRLKPGETLSDLIDEIEEAVGWDRLSPFGDESREGSEE